MPVFFAIKRHRQRREKGEGRREERGERRDSDFSYFAGLTAAVVTGAGRPTPSEEREKISTV